jgi:hypothetical protein
MAVRLSNLRYITVTGCFISSNMQVATLFKCENSNRLQYRNALSNQDCMHTVSIVSICLN